MGPLNFSLPRCCQVKWGEMDKIFKRASMTDKERKRAERKTEKMVKKLSLKD